MLINKPTYYYSIIRKKFSNSYFAEDERQVIIGIDCEYFDSNEYGYDSLKKIYSSFAKQKNLKNSNGLKTFEDIYSEIIKKNRWKKYLFLQY